MPLSVEERAALRRRCSVVLPGFAPATPAEEFERLAAWCVVNDVQSDHYGRGTFLETFEKRVATLVGKPAAALFPSGVMAQLAAVRIHGDARGLRRFGAHPTSHLLIHEEEAYAALLGFHAVPVGDRFRPIVVDDLAKVVEPLACLLVELPIRESGGLLPSWEALEALKAVALRRDLPLHMDGARLWESAAFYDRAHAAIAEGFDSVYVSLYKGLGGFAGAMLCGSDHFVAQARVWRRRFGGTLPTLTPFAASAAMRLDDRLAMMPALLDRTRRFAASLSTILGIRPHPEVPHVNQVHVYFDAPAPAVNAARDALAETDGCWIAGDVHPAAVPGWSVGEFVVGDRLLDVDDATVTTWFARLMASAAR